MSNEILKGKWKQYKGDAKVWWGQAIGDPEIMLDGSKDKVVGWVQEHYGIAKEKAEAEVDEFSSALDNMKNKKAEVESKIKSKYDKFNNEDLAEINGKIENWAEKLKEKYNKSQDEANAEIKDFMAQFKKEE